jgi:hypothetical protein
LFLGKISKPGGFATDKLGETLENSPSRAPRMMMLLEL